MNRLSPEIISRIFVLGSRDQGPGDHHYERGHAFLDESSAPQRFATPCSHVCQYWRNVALDTAELWTYLDFNQRPPFYQSREWITRSKTSLLTINLSLWKCGSKKKLIDQILTIILPCANRWRFLNIDACTNWHLQECWQPALINCPKLEYLSIIGSTASAQDPRPLSLFPSGAPQLQSVRLFYPAVDWELAATSLKGLRSLNVRFLLATRFIPSGVQLMRILSQSPELGKLDLCHLVTTPDPWPQECISLESLYELSLVFAHTPVAIAFFEHIDCPVLRKLTLGLWGKGGTVDQSIHAFSNSGYAQFRRVEILNVIFLPDSPLALRSFLVLTPKLKTLTLNPKIRMTHDIYKFRHREPIHQDLVDALLHPDLLCPKLDTLKIRFIGEDTLKNLIVVRKQGGAPISHLWLCTNDKPKDEIIEWLKGQVRSVRICREYDLGCEWAFWPW